MKLCQCKRKNGGSSIAVAEAERNISNLTALWRPVRNIVIFTIYFLFCTKPRDHKFTLCLYYSSFSGWSSYRRLTYFTADWLPVRWHCWRAFVDSASAYRSSGINWLLMIAQFPIGRFVRFVAAVDTGQRNIESFALCTVFTAACITLSITCLYSLVATVSVISPLLGPLSITLCSLNMARMYPSFSGESASLEPCLTVIIDRNVICCEMWMHVYINNYICTTVWQLSVKCVLVQKTTFYGIWLITIKMSDYKCVVDILTMKIEHGKQVRWYNRRISQSDEKWSVQTCRWTVFVVVTRLAYAF